MMLARAVAFCSRIILFASCCFCWIVLSSYNLWVLLLRYCDHEVPSRIDASRSLRKRYVHTSTPPPTASSFSTHSSLSAAERDDTPVTCGSAVKITSVQTKHYLNSEQKQLNGGSGQQVVTFVEDPGSHHTLWWLRPATHSGDGEYTDPDTCNLAEPIRCNSLIRLTHLDTFRNLHSHGVPSILSKQQEVTAYGTGDGKGDGGDDWKVLCDGDVWTVGMEVRLQHKDTGKYLGAAPNVQFNQQTCGVQCPLMNHLEAFGRTSMDKYSVMKVEQGVYISQ